MRIIPSSAYWSLHTHSKFSNGDALPDVAAIVARAKELNYPAIGLSDHGNIAGSVQLYKEARRAGIKPFPGSEIYYVPSTQDYMRDRANRNVKSKWFHMGVHAFTTEGYENLVRLSTASHLNHHYKPLVDAEMLSHFAEQGHLNGLALTTGCHFGLAVQTLIERGPDAAKRWLQTLETWFPGRVYVEAQNHLIDHVDHEGWSDELVSKELYSLANDLGMPMVITQDSHYIHLSERPAHETLKRLSSWSDTPDDATFPGDGFHMVDDRWMQEHHDPAIYEAGVAGLADLLNRHELSIGVLDNYSYSVPSTVDDPSAEMRRRVNQFLEDNELPYNYVAKAQEEMDVIDEAGMAPYMVLVAQITDHCTAQGWLFQTRGSAAGSVVAWAMGITQVDPIHWDLRFERFLSKDRTQPPDIDLDIQHDKRDDLMEWLREQYFITAIGTWMKLTMSTDDDDESKGSIMRKYYQMQGKIDGPTEWVDVPPDDREALRELDGHAAYTGMGRNAAGIIITNNPAEVARLVPLHHSSAISEGVSQYSKNDIEALGLVKLDVLGSKTLTVLAKAGELLKQDINSMLPIERKNSLMSVASRPVYQDMSKGNTAGVFQLEGRSTRRGLRDLRPTTVHDVIAAMALFRPAVMQSGATDMYISRKAGRAKTPERHSIIDKVVAKTHGIILFQEQVIDLLRALKMEADDLTKFLKAVKASNKDIGDAQKVIDSYMPWIEKRCVEEGFSDDDVAWLKRAFDAFGGYSFNRAHSTIYGLTAWRCAYLAHHHPLEFHTALLDVAAQGADRPKELSYVAAARERGIKVSRPHINISGESYTADHKHNRIRKGLTSIKGIGASAARSLVGARPPEGYRSIDELVRRLEGGKATGGKDYLAQAKRFERPVSSRYHSDEPPTIELLNGNLRTLLEAGILDDLIAGDDT